MAVSAFLLIEKCPPSYFSFDIAEPASFFFSAFRVYRSTSSKLSWPVTAIILCAVAPPSRDTRPI